jgi:UDPglucose 6-dehydrogenase
MQVGIVGNGVVGSALAQVYKGKHTVKVYDQIPSRSPATLPEVLACDVVFICLPEAALEGWCATIPQAARYTSYVIKSTVPVGTTRMLRQRYNLESVVHSPEFLTERTAAHDAAQPRVNIVGFPHGCGYNLVTKLYADTFPGVPVLMVTSDESETIKLAMNSFFAVKVAFWNEVAAWCKAKDISYPKVIAAIIAEGRVHPEHTRVPGPDGKCGFGGKCLPKDLQMLAMHMMAEVHPAHLLRAAMLRNKLDREV